jgi:hypothetical protein
MSRETPRPANDAATQSISTSTMHVELKQVPAKYQRSIEASLRSSRSTRDWPESASSSERDDSR